MIGKLNNEKILIAEDVKIALAFKLNGKAIIAAANRKFVLKNQKIISLDENLIAADGTGYTKGIKLREIYGLNE